MDAQKLLTYLRSAGVLYEVPPAGLAETLMEESWRAIEEEPVGVLADRVRSSEFRDPAALLGLQLVSLIEVISDTAAVEHLRDSKRFAFAVEDLGGNFNARAFAVGDTWVTLIDSAMMWSLYATARVAVKLMLPPGQRPTCESCGSAQCSSPSLATTARRWLETVVRISRGGGSLLSEHWQPTGAQLLEAGGITLAAERFVLAHELGHHVLGHSAHGTEAIAKFDGEEIKELIPSWVAEIEADAFALGVVVTAAIKEGEVRPGNPIDGQFLLEALNGVEHFLLTAEMLERLAGADGGSATHPPIWLRREAIKEHLRQLPFYASCESRTGGYRNSVSLLWRTLANPDRHSQRGWENERSEVRQRISQILNRYAPDRVAPTLEALVNLRFRCSQLFFDDALGEVANGGEKIWGPDGTEHAQRLLREFCDTPQTTLARLDPLRPFFGVVPQLDPRIVFPFIL